MYVYVIHVRFVHKNAVWTKVVTFVLGRNIRGGSHEAVHSLDINIFSKSTCGSVCMPKIFELHAVFVAQIYDTTLISRNSTCLSVVQMVGGRAHEAVFDVIGVWFSKNMSCMIFMPKLVQIRARFQHEMCDTTPISRQGGGGLVQSLQASPKCHVLFAVVVIML